MPIPILIGIGVAAAASYGAKKAYDGYQKHSESDEIVDKARERYDKQHSLFQKQEARTMNSLKTLGELELGIGKDFERFSILAESLLKQLNQSRQIKLEVQLPKHTLQKVEAYTYSAVGVLSSVATAGASGVAAGFAVYGGVMSFAAASTGTAISSLAGAAATNATLAAIGGGSLAAGGFGIAGGTAILGAAVAAPILAIAGWAYDSHGESALENAKKARVEVDQAVSKLKNAISSLEKTDSTVKKVNFSLTSIHRKFDNYLDKLASINDLISTLKKLDRDVDSELEKIAPEIMLVINNGYALAAILTDVISTPLFKLKKSNGSPVIGADGVPKMETDDDGSMIPNTEDINAVLATANNETMRFNAT